MTAFGKSGRLGSHRKMPLVECPVSPLAVIKIDQYGGFRRAANGQKRTSSCDGVESGLVSIAYTDPGIIIRRTTIYYGAREVASATGFEVPFASEYRVPVTFYDRDCPRSEEAVSASEKHRVTFGGLH